MTLTAKNTGGSFEKAPAGVHVARCIRLIDLGTQHNRKFDNWQHKVRVYWELPNAPMQTGEFAGQPFIVTKDYTLSLSEKADLRKDLKSWRGRDFTEQEAEAFDLSLVVDKCCLLNVVHEGDYANVAGIMPLPANTPCPPRMNELVVFDLEKFDDLVFAGFTERLQAKINASQERQNTPQEMGMPQGMGMPQDNAFNDDIPF